MHHGIWGIFPYNQTSFYMAATTQGLFDVELNDIGPDNFIQRLGIRLPNSSWERNDKAMEIYFTEYREYFSGQRQSFSFPLHVHGTSFQENVWAALTTIPYGETRSYQDIAHQIGKPKAVRAIGQANHVNPLSIVVPCHRVIGKNGNLTGYGGGLSLKAELLALEGRFHDPISSVMTGVASSIKTDGVETR